MPPRPQWRKAVKAVFQPAICLCMFLIVYLNFFYEKPFFGMMMFETTLYFNVGELSNKTDRDSGSIFDRYPDTSDDESYSMKPEEERHFTHSLKISLFIKS